MAPCASKTAPAAASSLRVGRETDTELLRVSGLKYTYAVLEQQVGKNIPFLLDQISDLFLDQWDSGGSC